MLSKILIIDKRKGFLDVVIPSHIIEQIQPTPPTIEETFNNDDMAEALLNVPLTLNAVLDKKTIPFRQILKWKKGTLLDLSYFDKKPLEMMCKNKVICKATLTVDKKMFFATVQDKKGEE